jgi:hypothetical protein
MKQTTLTLLFLISASGGFSQASPHFSVNGQLLANSYNGGFNLQRDFIIDKYSHFSVAVGFGYTHQFIFTNHLTYSTGKGKNYLEAGLAASYVDFRTKDLFIQRGYLILPLLGYKYLTPEGFIARFHFTPVIQNGRIYPFGGMSIGLYLRKNKSNKPFINTIRFTRQ